MQYYIPTYFKYYVDYDLYYAYSDAIGIFIGTILSNLLAGYIC